MRGVEGSGESDEEECLGVRGLDGSDGISERSDKGRLSELL